MTTIYLLIVNSFGRSATRRAFRYIFARLISPRSKKSVPESHSPYPNPDSLAKDAAPIPNATCKKRIVPVETRQCDMP